MTAKRLYHGVVCMDGSEVCVGETIETVGTSHPFVIGMGPVPVQDFIFAGHRHRVRADVWEAATTPTGNPSDFPGHQWMGT